VPGTFFGLDIASTALTAAQTMMDVAAQNIANDATPGYSQQVADLVATTPYAQPDMGGLYTPQLGTGVEVQSVTRQTASYLDSLYRTTQSDESAYSTRTSYLQSLQSVLDEPGSNGLSAAMNTFFSDYQTLSQNPQSSSARTVVQQDAESLADQIQEIYQGLQSVGQQAQNQATLDVGTVNSDLKQLANLNTTISEAQAIAQQPNNLLDQRDDLLNSLSQLIGIQVSTQTATVGGNVTSQVTVTMPTDGGGAVTLVSGGQYGSLSVQPTATSANTYASPTANPAGLTNETDTINGVGVTISSTDTLQDIADNINAANAGVTAQVVQQGSSYQLALLSTNGQAIAGSGQDLFGTASQGLAINLGTAQSTLAATDVTGTSATVTAPWTTGDQSTVQGSIGAAMQLVNYDLNPNPSTGQSLMSEFTQAVSALTGAVNTQQEAGYYLDPTSGDWTLGPAMFTSDNGGALTPADVEVNPLIQQSGAYIAASGALQSQNTVASASSGTFLASGTSVAINGVDVAVTGPATLDDVVSAINGTAGVGVTASPVQTSNGQYALELVPASGQAPSSVTGLQIELPAAGNGQNATAMADIAQQQGGPMQTYASFVSDMGAAVDLSQNLQNTSQSLLTQITSQQQSVSGVSINEQMTNLIQAQAMYTAAAQVANIMDQSLQSLLNAF